MDKPCIMQGKIVNREDALTLIKHASEMEIWDALEGIGNTKAPGLDGFNAYFFKEAWQIIKHDVVDVIQDFFKIGKIHRALNCSLITLIPKSNEAGTIKDWRPIS